MTVEEMIAEELDLSGNPELAEVPLEVELDIKGTYSISGPLPLAPRTSRNDTGLRTASE